MRLSLFRLLPDELIGLIWEKIPLASKAWLSRDFFARYHPMLYSRIQSRARLSMHREMVRTDASFVMRRILSEQGKGMLVERNYRFNVTTYPTYIQFLLEWGQRNGATRCVEMIQEFRRNSGLGTNRPKNNRTKGTRWSN